MRTRVAIFGFTIVLSCFATGAAAAQQQAADLNAYYQYPIGFGVGVQMLTPFWGDESAYFTTKLDAWLGVRYPLPWLPIIQPLARLGFMQFAYSNKADSNPDKYDQNHFYAMFGAAYSNRMSKNLELGADAAIGMGEAIFPHIDPGATAGQYTPRGSPTLMARITGHLGLDPSYNLNIDLVPSLSYMYYLTPITLFDRLILGIGATISYRPGTDPDSPQAIIRSIKFSNTSISPVFAAMQSYYVDHPVGTVTITNTETFSISDINVQFYQKGYMDSPTQSQNIDQLAPGKSTTVNLLAAYNGNVFTTQGDTPLNGEITVSYLSRSRAASQTQSISYTLHDRNAISWDDNRKEAAFITPKDSALQNFASHIRQVTKNDTISGLSTSLQNAMQIFYGLKEIGILYQKDPNTPFANAQANAQILDTVNLPRETLSRLTGDCDDLTALYNSLLETIGIKTGYITVPGHIYSVFDTGVRASEYRLVHPDPNMTFNIDGELWVPVEITMIGTSDFLTAWRQAMAEWHDWDKDTSQRNLYQTEKAQTVYQPVALQEKDLGLQYGSDANVRRNFTQGLNTLVDAIIASYSDEAEKSKRKADYNTLGIVAAQFARYALAERAFNTALALDRNYLNAVVNLGNLYYLQQQYQSALRYFTSAQTTLSQEERTASSLYASVLLNISQSYYQLGNFDRAKEYFDKLKAVDPDLANRNNELGAKSGQARGSDASTQPGIIYADQGSGGGQ